MTNIKISVSTKHFKAATNYSSNHTCPLAMALKEMFPDKDICVGGTDVDIDEDTYNINNEWGNDDIDEQIQKAKSGKRVPTYKVILTP